MTKDAAIHLFAIWGMLSICVASGWALVGYTSRTSRYRNRAQGGE